MKHYFKKLPVFLYICVALIAYGCSEEKDFVKNQNHEKIKMEDQSFEKLLQLPIFNDAYQRVVKANVKIPNSTMARTALEEQYGFDIVTQVPVRIITTPDNGTFFVMLIERPTKEYLKFENLIINVKDVDVTAAIIKYEMANLAEKIDAIDSYIFDFTDTSITSLVIDGKMMYYGPCADVATLMCNQSWDIAGGTTTPHPATALCVGTPYGVDFLSVVTSQIGDCSSGGGSTGPSGATGPAAAGGGATVGSIYTAPLPCLECFEEEPCDKLKDLIKNYPNNAVNPFKKALQDNHNAVGQFAYEVGQKIRMTGSNYNELAINDVQSPDGCNQLTFTNLINAFNFGFFHSHPISCGKYGVGEMFSAEDIGVFMEMVKHHNFGNSTYPNSTPVNPYNFVLTVASAHGTFAIKINDFEAFKNKANEILTSEDNFDVFSEFYSNSVITENTRIELNDEHKKVLSLLKTLNTTFGNSLSVYKAESNFTGWNKLVLNETKNNYNPIPCNN